MEQCGGRVPRHSSGWKELLKHLRAQESLRILDIGPTSSTNINYITSLGHSIYMANVVEEASKPEWLIASAEAGEPPALMSIAFSRAISTSPAASSTLLSLGYGRLSARASIGPVFLAGIHEVLQPGGLMLAFFHQTIDCPRQHFCRYHLTDTDVVEMQRAGNLSVLHIYNNRKIENMLSEYANYPVLSREG